MRLKNVIKKTTVANHTNMDNIKNNQGVALIIVIGVLALLAVLGASFTIDMRLEQKAATNYNYAVKAKYLAKAGIEKAVAVLREYANDYASFCYDADDGVDDDGDGIPDYQGFEKCTPASGPEKWKWTTNVTLGNITGVITVYVIDCASQICVNDGNNPNLDEILENLVTILGAPLDVGDGTAIATALGNGVFLTKEEIKTRVSAIDNDEYNAIKDYITVNTWINTAMSPDRAPVNMNTASQEVLEAVLLDISDGVNDIVLSEATTVANQLISDRPIQTWTEFNNSVDSTSLGAADKNLVKDNCNPNNAKPATYTTEFCFNSGGYFEIESIGTIYDLAGNIAAEKKIRTVVKIFGIWHQTTQSEFTANIRPGITVDATLGQVYAAATGIYSNDFEANMDGWDTGGGAARVTSLPADAQPLPSGAYAIELEGNETTYLDIPNQVRTLYVSMYIYACDTTVDGINFYLSKNGTSRGPDIKMAGGVSPTIKYYDTTTGSYEDFQSSETYSGWKQVEFIVDTLDETYNVYMDNASTPKQKSGGGYEIDFRDTSLGGINRINVANLATAATVYFDDIEIRCGGPMTTPLSNACSPVEEIVSWGTIAWTEEDQTLSAPNEIKLELSDDGLTWVGPDGSSSAGWFYNSAIFGSNLDEGSTTIFYCNPAGTVIPTAHDPLSPPALDTLYYSASLSTIDLLAEPVKLYDVTITYLPTARILSWQEITE